MAQSKRQGLAERFLSGLIDAVRLLEAGDEAKRAGKETPLWQRLERSGRADTKLVQEMLHLLYVRCNGRAAAKKELRSCWPITESSQQKEFKAAMQAWVRGLAAADQLPQQAAHYFVTAYQTWGMRTAELLFHLAVLALEAELERRHPELLTTVAPTLQDAAPTVFDLAVAEDQHRLQLEVERLGQLLGTLQRLQQVFQGSAAAAGEGAPHLQPWWPTSQAHAERVLAMQQLLRRLSHLADVPHLAHADQTLGLLFDAAAAPPPCLAEQSNSTAGVLQVLAVRTAVAGQQGSAQPTPRNEADCPALNCKVANRHFHLKIGDMGKAVSTARELVWTAVRAQHAQPQPEPEPPLAAAPADGTSPAMAHTSAGSAAGAQGEIAARSPHACTPPPPVALPGTGQPHQDRGLPSPGPGSFQPSPTLASMLESHLASPSLLSHCALFSTGFAGAASPGAGGFSMPPSLTPTPCWGNTAAAASRAAVGASAVWGSRAGGAAAQAGPPAQERLVHPHNERQEEEQEGCLGGHSPPQQQPQPGSPCFAESIASFSVPGYGFGSAAEAVAHQQDHKQPGSPRLVGAVSSAGGLRQPSADLLFSPMASASMEPIRAAPFQASLEAACDDRAVECVTAPAPDSHVHHQRQHHHHQQRLRQPGEASSVTAFSPPRPLSDSPVTSSSRQHADQEHAEPRIRYSRNAESRSAAPGLAAFHAQLSRLAGRGVTERAQPFNKSVQQEAAPVCSPDATPLQGVQHTRPAPVATDSPAKQQLVAVSEARGSPTVSLYSPPKALDSPAGSVISQRHMTATLKNVTNSAQHRKEPSKADVDSLRLRFQRLKSKN
ncbi:hypothetical protein N2152v2_007313 [Parachlorella kessleri]